MEKKEVCSRIYSEGQTEELIARKEKLETERNGLKMQLNRLSHPCDRGEVVYLLRKNKEELDYITSLIKP